MFQNTQPGSEAGDVDSRGALLTLREDKEMVSGWADELLVWETPQGAIVQAEVWRSLVQLGPGTDKPDWRTQQKRKG